MNSGVSRNLRVPVGPSLARSWRVVQAWVHARLFTLALGTVGFGVIALHFYGLTRSPPGFYVDEAALGYNAYAITVDDRDEFGESWPLFFRSFGDYKSPVLIYLIAGVMWLFGPSVGIVRLVPNLVSLITAVALGWLAYQLFRDRWLGMATFAVAGTVPWLFVIGRIAFEPIALPAALTLFLLAWWYADQESSRPRRQLLMAVLGVCRWRWHSIPTPPRACSC